MDEVGDVLYLHFASFLLFTPCLLACPSFSSPTRPNTSCCRSLSFLTSPLRPSSARQKSPTTHNLPPWQAALHTGSQTPATPSQTRCRLHTPSLRASTRPSLSEAMRTPPGMPAVSRLMVRRVTMTDQASIVLSVSIRFYDSCASHCLRPTPHVAVSHLNLLATSWPSPLPFDVG